MSTAQVIRDAELDDWRKLAQAMHGRFLTGSFADGIRFAELVGEESGGGAEQPELRLGAGFVDVRLNTEDGVRPGSVPPGMTQRAIETARRISAIARSSGLTPDPSAVAQLELALDTSDPDAVGPFWAAVLTGDAGAYQGGDVCDPTGRVANLWFQGTDPHEEPRQRFHLDLWLPPEVIPARIKAALAAGGTITYDEEVPAFTVLADPQGNKVCLCTSEGR